MKWLMTTGADAQITANYVRWLGSAALSCDLVGPADSSPSFIAAYSALLLGGGGDIDPVLYGELPATGLLRVDPLRDTNEMALVKSFMALGKPVFGICRGIQLINVYLGGKLILHIPDRVPQQTEEHGSISGSDSLHPLLPIRTTRMGSALENAKDVNSSHHQAVEPTALGKGLAVTAISPAGIVESVEGKEDLPSPILAVQWHPERLQPGHPASRNLLLLMKQMCGKSSRSSP